MIEELLPVILERIVDAVRPEMVVLFGSHAKGRAEAGSDIDLLVVEREPFGKQRSRLKEIGKLERSLGKILLPMDVLVYSMEEIERWRQVPTHVVAHALAEGRVLYARA